MLLLLLDHEVGGCHEFALENEDARELFSTDNFQEPSCAAIVSNVFTVDP
jgi:hypothetical protein